MTGRLLIAVIGVLLSGCIIFDKKSEAVTFHQLAAASASTTRPGPQLFVPRAVIPSALRRPNLVMLDDTGWVRVEDAHRWIAPLDRAVSEAVGRHLSALSGLPAVAQSPAEDHLLVLLTIDKMEIFAPAGAGRSLFSLPGSTDNLDTAVLQITYRLERSDGTFIGGGTLHRSHPLKERAPSAFVQAQSANLAMIAAEIAKLLPPPQASK